MNVTIREARVDDAEALIPYVQRLAAEPDIDLLLQPGEFDLTVEEEQQILADYAAAENSIYLVAEVEGQIVGSLNCQGSHRRAARHVVMLGMSVAREWRGQGIGTRLLEHALQWARETGIVTRIELFVFARNTGAIRLYERFGFVIEGRRRRSVYKDDQYMDDLLMALLL